MDLEDHLLLANLTILFIILLSFCVRILCKSKFLHVMSDTIIKVTLQCFVYTKFKINVPDKGETNFNYKFGFGIHKNYCKMWENIESAHEMVTSSPGLQLSTRSSSSTAHMERGIVPTPSL